MSQVFRHLTSRWLVHLVIVAFLILFGLISLVNHSCFRTHALDLGMFNQALYQFSCGRGAEFSQSIDGHVETYLSDHFSPVIVLLSPLRYLLGTYTLLIVQLLGAGVGAFFLFRLSQLYGINRPVGILLVIHVFSLWGVYAAFAYDFHTNVLGSFFVFPFLFYLTEGRMKSAGLILLAMLICKENMALLIILIGIALLAHGYGKNSNQRKALMWMISFSAFYFVLVTAWIMPLLADSAQIKSVQSSYGAYGSNVLEVFVFLITNPGEVFKSLLNNEAGVISGVKMTSLFFTVLGGGILIWMRIWFLLPVGVLLALRFISQNEMMWDIHKQYSIEICIVLSLLMLESARLYGGRRFFKYSLAAICLIAGYYSFREVVVKSTEANVFSSAHYISVIDHQEFRYVRDMVQGVDTICCSSNLSPHLSFRNRVYLYPNLGGAGYIIANSKDAASLMTRSLDDPSEDINGGKDLEIIYRGSTIWVFRKLTSEL